MASSGTLTTTPLHTTASLTCRRSNVFDRCRVVTARRVGRGPARPRPAVAPVPGPSTLTHRQILRILPGLILALSLVTLNQTMVSVALPTSSASSAAATC